MLTIKLEFRVALSNLVKLLNNFNIDNTFKPFKITFLLNDKFGKFLKAKIPSVIN